jgi:hypothetical protein
VTDLRTLVASIRDDLGAGQFDENATALSADIDAATTVLPVSSTDGLSAGVYEIDFERVRVKSVDSAGLMLFPFGRGYAGSTATEHLAGSMVAANPTVPASTIVQTMNSVLRRIFPRIFAVGGTDVELTDGQAVLPSECYGVVSVWDGTRRIDAWKYDQEPRLLEVLSGASDGFPLGTITVVYARKPGTYDLKSIDADSSFEDTTFLPDRMVDLVRLGVAAELAPRYEFARLLHTGVEHRVDPQSKPAGHGMQVGRYLEQQFLMRLEDESAQLRKEFPVRIHHERKGRI